MPLDDSLVSVYVEAEFELSKVTEEGAKTPPLEKSFSMKSLEEAESSPDEPSVPPIVHQFELASKTPDPTTHDSIAPTVTPDTDEKKCCSCRLA